MKNDDEIPNSKREVTVYGHGDRLFVNTGMNSCGPLLHGEGVGFRFGREGAWVVPLEELRAIVREADEFRAKHGPQILAKWAAEEAEEGEVES